MAAAIVRQLRNPWSAKTDMSSTVRSYTSYVKRQIIVEFALTPLQMSVD